MIRRWTLGRAVGIGATAGLIALILWPFLGPDCLVYWPFVLIACVAGLCGGWLVVATMFDLTFHRPRGERLRPVRAFDLVLGSGLFLLAYLELRDAFDWLSA
ncbi:MAG TPA: hypothetical protein VFW19_18945 [Allosphingosinicella sp.]|nr:hypothetical protein [Allosphingosinicella sp.]